MKKLTDTQKKYVNMLEHYGYIIVAQGYTYATYVIHKQQMHSSSFEALLKHNLIERVSKYVSPKGLIVSIWKRIEKEQS